LHYFFESNVGTKSKKGVNGLSSDVNSSNPSRGENSLIFGEVIPKKLQKGGLSSAAFPVIRRFCDPSVSSQAL